MSIFANKKKEFPKWFMDDEPTVSFDQVVNYLEHLDQRAFDRLLKVVNIYRKANKEASKFMGSALVPAKINKQGRSGGLSEKDIKELKHGIIIAKPEKGQRATLNG